MPATAPIENLDQEPSVADLLTRRREHAREQIAANEDAIARHKESAARHEVNVAEWKRRVVAYDEAIEKLGTATLQPTPAPMLPPPVSQPTMRGRMPPPSSRT